MIPTGTTIIQILFWAMPNAWIKTAKFLAQFGMVHGAGSWKCWLLLINIIRKIQDGCIWGSLLPSVRLCRFVPASLTHDPFSFSSTLPHLVSILLHLFCWTCLCQTNPSWSSNITQFIKHTLFLKLILLFSREFAWFSFYLSGHFLFPFSLSLFRNVYKALMVSEKNALFPINVENTTDYTLFLMTHHSALESFSSSRTKKCVCV